MLKGSITGSIPGEERRLVRKQRLTKVRLTLLCTIMMF